MGLDGDHRHCKSCGKVCGLTEDTCSKACAKTLARKQENLARARRNYWYAFFASVVIVAITSYAYLR
jgi:predicted nucleic acid-binding Zn ribbon protein